MKTHIHAEPRDNIIKFGQYYVQWWDTVQIFSVQTVVDVECTRLIGPGSAVHDATLLILLGDVRAIHVTGEGGIYHGCKRGHGTGLVAV
jgi:hypothetical protein